MKKTLFFLLFITLLNAPGLHAQFGRSPYAQEARLYIPYRDGNLWGYCDTLGKVLLPAKYDSAGFFTGWFLTAAVVKKDGKYGVLWKNFKEAIPCKYDKIVLHDCCGTLQLFGAQKDGKFGILDNNEDEVAPFEYDSLSFEYLSDSYMIVEKAGKFGAYGYRKGLLIPVEYDMLESARFYRSATYQGSLIGKKGNTYYELTPKFAMEPIANGDKVATEVLDKQAFDAAHPEKLSPETMAHLKQVEDTLRRTHGIKRILFKRPVGFDLWTNEYEYVLAEKNRKVALVHISRGQIASDYYDDIVDVKGADVVMIEDIGMEEIGETAPASAPAVPAYNQLVFVKKGEKYGAVSETGKTIFPFDYDGFGQLDRTGMVTIQKGKKGMIIFNTIYQPIACKYDRIGLATHLPVSQVWSFGVFQVKKDGKPGYVGENGVEYFK